MKKKQKIKNRSARAKRQKNNGERYHNSSLNLSSLQAKEVTTQGRIDEAVAKLGFEAFDYKVRIPGGWVCIPKGKATPELREKLHALVAELEGNTHE